MSFVMGQKKTQRVEEAPSPAPIPTMDDASVANMKEKAQREMRTRRGRRSTILSAGPLGDQGAANYRASLS